LEHGEFHRREGFGALLAVAVDVGGQRLERCDRQLMQGGLISPDPLQVLPGAQYDPAQLGAEGGAGELAREAVG
jgi:hypothetical protein